MGHSLGLNVKRFRSKTYNALSSTGHNVKRVVTWNNVNTGTNYVKNDVNQIPSVPMPIKL